MDSNKIPHRQYSFDITFLILTALKSTVTDLGNDQNLESAYKCQSTVKVSWLSILYSFHIHLKTMHIRL